MKKFLFSIVGLAIAALVIYMAFFRQDAAPDQGEFTLETTDVENGEVAQIVSASGAVRALTTVEVGSQVSGQIVALNADFNTEVKAGDIIARIDPQTFETRVASTKADVESADANLAVQKANIASAEANLAQAEREMNVHWP